jgi:hypothetical protein
VGKCSDETLTKLLDTLLSGCRQDLVQYADLTQEHDDEVKKLVLQVYPVARDALCLVEYVIMQIRSITMTNLTFLAAILMSVLALLLPNAFIDVLHRNFA